MLLACSQTFCFLFRDRRVRRVRWPNYFYSLTYSEKRKKQRLWTSLLHNRRFMSQRGERGILRDARDERGFIFFFSPRLALLAKFRVCLAWLMKRLLCRLWSHCIGTSCFWSFTKYDIMMHIGMGLREKGKAEWWVVCSLLRFWRLLNQLP